MPSTQRLTWGLMSQTVRSWPERKSRVRCLTDWATQTSRLPPNLTNSLLLTGILTNNINGVLMHILVCYVSYILYFYNKISEKKENVIKKIIRKRKYIYNTILYLSKKTCTHKWTHAVKTCVVQGSTVHYFVILSILTLISFSCKTSNSYRLTFILL